MTDAAGAATLNTRWSGVAAAHPSDQRGGGHNGPCRGSWRALVAYVGAAATVFLGGCAGNAAAGGQRAVEPVPAVGAALAGAASDCCLDQGYEVAERYRVTAITQRRFTQEELWRAIEPSLRSPVLRVTGIGRSIQGRPLRAVTFGHGPTTVLLWSQMHGDESTATMALADLMAWFASTDDVQRPLRERIAAGLTVVMVPMLNPDGAELFQRQNAVGVDVNRDAASRATPEARALKALRDSIRPAFGYNLHDQNARTLAGPGREQVAIALLAPEYDETGSFGGARANARLVASTIASVLERAIPGRVARYDDSFNPRAFGDLMQSWGTSTVLIESGALPGDPEKQRLRTLNVVAILSSLDAIVTGRVASADPRIYDALATNSRSAVDVVIVGGQVVLPGQPEPLRVDVAMNYDDPVARRGPRVREVGDLRLLVALDTVTATGLFLHPDRAMLTERDGRYWLRVDAPASFTLRRGPDPASEVVPGLLPPAEWGLERGLSRADSLVEAAVGRSIAGAVLMVSRDGAPIHQRAFGYAQLNDSAGRRLAEPPTMHTGTLFDLASVTKVAATTYALMLLVDRGLVDVDAPVSRYLSDFRGPRLDSITVRHLLTHTAGLVQWQPLYYQASTPAQTYAAIRAMPLQWGVGEGRHYSDLGFMLLGYVVERVTGQPLDSFLERELYAPLALGSTGFRPTSHGSRDIAATESGNGYEYHMVHDSTFGYRYTGDPASWDGWRRRVLVGEVNDGNAWYANGGVAGHAGLFSTAAELGVLVDVLVAGGRHDGVQVVGRATVERFLTRDRTGHYLGWMRPEGMPEGSFAHNGFTGTYVLGVPSQGLSVVLLTNRQNMGTDERGYFPDVGPLQSAVARAIVEGATQDALVGGVTRGRR